MDKVHTKQLKSVRRKAGSLQHATLDENIYKRLRLIYDIRKAPRKLKKQLKKQLTQLEYEATMYNNAAQ